MVYEKLHDFQRQAVNHIVKGDRVQQALFADTGVGKTWIAAGVMEVMSTKWYPNGFDVLLVVQKSNLESTWLKMLQEQLPHLHVVLTWKEFLKLGSSRTSRIFILTYGQVRRLIDRLCKRTWHLVVYDESHALKDRGSAASRAAARLHKAVHRLILSGTPIEQRPMDLFGQFRFLVPELLGTWTEFSREWCYQSGWMGTEWKFKLNRLPQFLKLLRPYTYRLRKRDAFKLPPLKVVNVKVPLLGKQRQLYEKLERDMVGEVNGHKITSQLTVTNLIRLQQVAGGFIRTDTVTGTRTSASGRVRTTYRIETTGGNAKLRKVAAIAKRVGPPVVVFCRFLEELEMVRMNFPMGWKVGTIHGLTRNRVNRIELFQQGALDALVCQIRTGGVGIDLYRSHNAVIYSSTWSSIDDDQAIGRLYRYGQDKPTTIWRIMATDTIDEDIHAALKTKNATIQSVLSRFRARVTSR